MMWWLGLRRHSGLICLTQTFGIAGTHPCSSDSTHEDGGNQQFESYRLAFSNGFPLLIENVGIAVTICQRKQ
ncbi:hypothetical protein BDR07DRAFT_1420981 [Suillus spraguei]|nr:hypothetical protein BDR07DRAFT_1420981 [Suillus spraguei]